MIRLVTAVAAFASGLAYLVILVVGVTLAGVEQSGARGMGALLAVGATVAFAAALFICFAPAAKFRTAAQRARAAAACVLGTLPALVLAIAAFTFAGLPTDSPMPKVDWPLFAAGCLFSLGGLALLWVGWRRTSRPGPTQSAEVVTAAEPLTPA